MTKRQLIEEIRRANATVEEAFLVKFTEQALQDYLRRLTERGRRNVGLGSVPSRRGGIKLKKAG